MVSQRKLVTVVSLLLLAALPMGALANNDLVLDENGIGDAPGRWRPSSGELLEEVQGLRASLTNDGHEHEHDPESPPPRETGGDGTKEIPLGGGVTIQARTDDNTKPVLMVHGRDNYDMGGYADLVGLFSTTYGFSGGVYRQGYYGGECNVEYRAEHHGSHNTWFAGSGEHSSKTGCTGGSGAQVHDLDTDIRHMSYHLAWAIHDHFSQYGTAVDVVAHSMGGLMIRYAIAHVGDASWPSTLLIEDVTTMGTPHGGLGTSWCKWTPWDDVGQMCSDSSMMTWLDANAQDPQASDGTDWTLMGSDCDGWVAWNLAVDMDAAHKVVNVNPCYGHSDYYQQVSTTNDATMDYQDQPDPTWYRWSSAPHSGKWAVYASWYGSW